MKLSNSKLDKYRSCPRAYQYHYVNNLEPITDGEESHDRNFGKAIHCGLEELYRSGDLEKSKEEFNEAYPNQLDIEDESKTSANGKVLLEAYWKTYQKQMQDWKIIAIEVLDSYEAIPGVEFRVRLDLIAENLKYGGVYGFDHKTTGKKLDYRYWSQFNPSSQISAYYDYIGKKYGQCAGFYIDAMSFGHRKNKYKGEPAGFHYQLERQMFTQTKAQIDDWRASEQDWYEKIQVSEAKGFYPLNTKSCQYCSFRNICSSGWDWENDSDLILCQYQKRNVDKEIIADV